MYLKSDNDGSLFIKSQRWKDVSGSLQFHTRSSSTIPATMNKQSTVFRISFSWKKGDKDIWMTGDDDRRIVIKIVKESEVLFEIEDLILSCDTSYIWSKVNRYYNCSHNFIKNLEEGCHFELHYAVRGENYLGIKDFELYVEGKLIKDIIA